MPLKRFLQTPPQDPTRNYDIANKKYVDDHIGGGTLPSTGTTGYIAKFAGTDSLAAATNTDTQVADAVSKAHTHTVGTLAARPTGATGDLYFVNGDGTAGNNGILWVKTSSGWVAVTGVFV